MVAHSKCLGLRFPSFKIMDTLLKKLVKLGCDIEIDLDIIFHQLSINTTKSNA